MDDIKTQICELLDRDLGFALTAVYDRDPEEAALRLEAFARRVRSVMDCDTAGERSSFKQRSASQASTG